MRKKRQYHSWLNLTIEEAIQRLVEQRSQQITAGTAKNWTQAAAVWGKMYPAKKVGQFSLSDIELFQARRAAAGSAPGTINTQVAIARITLRRSHVWQEFAESYKRVRPNPRQGLALSLEQQAQLLRIARSRKAWRSAGDALTLALRTGMRIGEIKNLRWADIDLSNQTIAVTKSKTQAGLRIVPLNDEALEVLQKRLHAATRKNGADAVHFVFPFEEGRPKQDPTRPRASFAQTWDRIRTAAGMPTLHFHDSRHTAITTLAEAGVPDWVIRAHVGHVDPSMLAHYSHVRLNALREAATALSPKRHEPARAPAPLPKETNVRTRNRRQHQAGSG